MSFDFNKVTVFNIYCVDYSLGQQMWNSALDERVSS